VVDAFSAFFTYLPLAAEIETTSKKRMLCVHGGFSNLIDSSFKEKVMALDRPIDCKMNKKELDEKEQLVIDILWSDPNRFGTGIN